MMLLFYHLQVQLKYVFKPQNCQSFVSKAYYYVNFQLNKSFPSQLFNFLNTQLRKQYIYCITVSASDFCVLEQGAFKHKSDLQKQQSSISSLVSAVNKGPVSIQEVVGRDRGTVAVKLDRESCKRCPANSMVVCIDHFTELVIKNLIRIGTHKILTIFF